MASILAALNWAAERGWLEAVPKIAKVKTAKLRAMKGRPLAAEEFERMLDVTSSVVGKEAAPAWLFVLRGLWESALRLDELLHVSWDDQNMICPDFNHSLLAIPADLQKNDTEEEIPLLPGFEQLMLEVPMDDREGWVFNPKSLQGKSNRKLRHGRPTSEWVGRIVSRIGKKAGVIVHPGDPKTGRPKKFASAHDLRRSCLQRLAENPDVPEKTVRRIARHASSVTTERFYTRSNARQEAKQLREALLKPVPGYTDELQFTCR